MASTNLELTLNRNNKNHSKTILHSNYQTFLKDHIYSYFVTVTFRYDPNIVTANIYLNNLLHYVNSVYFGKNYKNIGKYINGFVAYEYHKSGSVHFHMLIERNPCFDYHSDKHIEDVLYDKSKKVLSQSNYPVFSNKSFDVKDVYSDNIVDYAIKEGYQLNYDNISFLSKDGIIFCD